MLEWLAPGRCSGQVSGGAWLVPQFLSDGKDFRAVVWNASPDACDEFGLACPDEWPKPTQAILIDAASDRHACEISGNNVRLSVPMQQWECVILY
jgi:hypothetical protein